MNDFQKSWLRFVLRGFVPDPVLPQDCCSSFMNEQQQMALSYSRLRVYYGTALVKVQTIIKW